jgi:two-component system sensor histidine kinase CreC
MKFNLKAPMRITRIVVFLVVYITALGFYSLYRNLTSELEDQTFQATEESLVDTAHIFAAQLESQLSETDKIPYQSIHQALTKAKEHQFKADIFGMEKTQIGCNFYITGADGIIIHDSSHPERIGKNFSLYNDVLLALKDKYAVRSSRDDEDNSKSSVLYVAAPIKNADKDIVGVISVYKAQNDLRPFIDKRHRSILISLALIGTGIAAFTIAVFIWLFRPLGRLTNYARAITRGERPQYPKLGKGREANTLGKALRDMRASLDGRRYMEQYTQMLTHELKSPLAAIQGASELLEEDMPDSQRDKFLRNIQQETQRSTDIIDGLLKLSHLEAKDSLPQREPIFVDSLFSKVNPLISTRLNTKQLTLEIDCQESLKIYGDTMMLETALVNLLENAIEFSPENGVIHLSASAAGGQVTLSVTDHGPGLAPFVKERAFEHFFSMREKGKGSGLGLVFVKEVAKLHSGSVSIGNHHSGGAIACITLPQ